MAEKNFRNGAKPKSKKLPSSFYGSITGGGSASKIKPGTSGGAGFSATAGIKFGKNKDLSLEATGSGNLGFFIPNKTLQEKFGVKSQRIAGATLAEIKAEYNISPDTKVGVTYNPKERGVFFRLTSKF